ncbi:4'-phosphopantetheinyl transferase superfamily protein [Kordiimonas sp. SCSIO 12610]|uniref:4'-phosphopantetheinyl transferase family protein n=1 Tax=Kordiimonas sp. SCSIO 12610 TaxID=2829597 RepID=UPI00210A971C|nr:4'-phosphopantetheinyl transferase superfamily protein [Kordiimonas sp. SCSIO 12610]UTW56231.1 4'-phosphopantetheinyl transferase superfamily protein [Kordiimonas sp. SCSIO 12610]
MISITVKKANPECAQVALSGDSPLAPFEIERLNTMHADNRAAFVTGRLTLRSMLGQKLGIDPRDVPLMQEGAGRVILNREPETGAFDQDVGQPYFSVSHTNVGETAYVAVAVGDAPIGIDLDNRNRTVNWRRISDRHFHPKNRAVLNGLSGAEATDAFFKYWTFAEALVKLEDGKLLPYLHGLEIALTQGGGALKGTTPLGDKDISLKTYNFKDTGLMFGVAVKGQAQAIQMITDLSYET